MDHLIYRMFRFYGWKSTSVIFFTNNNENVHEDAYRKFVNALKNDQICFYSATINPNIDQNFHQIVQKVKNQNPDHPKVLFGDKNDQIKFINAVERISGNNVNRFWIGHNLVYSIEDARFRNLISVSSTVNIIAKKLVTK